MDKQSPTESTAQFLVRGVDAGCKRILISRLRNHGNDLEKSKALAESLLPLTLRFWQRRMEYHCTYPEPGGDPELPYTNAFADLNAFVDDKIILQDGNIAPLKSIIEGMNEIDRIASTTLS